MLIYFILLNVKEYIENGDRNCLRIFVTYFVKYII